MVAFIIDNLSGWDNDIFMVTIQDASVYSLKGEIAYQIDYNEGTSIRVVDAPGRIIRTEHKTANGWVSTKPYKVTRDNRRNGERIKAMVINFLGEVAR